MRPTTIYVGPLAAASANAIALSQTLGAAGPLTLNGSLVSSGVATMDATRQVLLTSAGNDSGINFTITGTGPTGAAQSETVTGANAATVASVLSYATIKSITASGATAGNVTAGTNTVADSPWVRFDTMATGAVAAMFTTTGTVNYTLYLSMDDPNDVAGDPRYGGPLPPALMTWDASLTPVEGATASVTINIPATPVFAKVRINSGTGSVKAQFSGSLAS